VPLIHVEVRGRVQGVGFRWFVRQRAQSLALAGWVKNLGSGGVEIVASGTEPAIDELLAALRQGPPGAIVSEVVTLAPPGTDDLPSPFSIAR
jgi:acylphosphatase